MAEIISGTKILDKHIINYVVGGPYTLLIYNSKTKEIEHLLEDETGLTEFSIAGTDLVMECTKEKESALEIIAANKLTTIATADELIGDTK